MLHIYTHNTTIYTHLIETIPGNVRLYISFRNVLQIRRYRRMVVEKISRYRTSDFLGSRELQYPHIYTQNIVSNPMQSQLKYTRSKFPNLLLLPFQNVIKLKHVQHCQRIHKILLGHDEFIYAHMAYHQFPYRCAMMYAYILEY